MKPLTYTQPLIGDRTMNRLPVVPRTFEQMQEEMFEQNVQESTQQLMNEFSFKEHMQIAFVPLVLEKLAWYYADRVLQQAARDRIDILKKLGRAMKHLKDVYNEELKKDLDYRHMKTIETVTEEFRQKFNTDFTIMWFTCKAEFLRTMPNYPYADMRTDAIIALLMIRTCRQHCKEMDVIIAKRLGYCENSIMKPTIEKLETCMEAYAGELGKFDFQNGNILLSCKILRKNLTEIEFEQDKEPTNANNPNIA